MKRYSCIIVISLVLLCWSKAVFAASMSRPVKKGNKLYKRQDFEGALKEYEKAQQDLPDSDIVNFNIGAALYKKGDYQKAIDAFTRALVTEDPGIEAKANYNIGNAKYRQAQKAESIDLQAAAGLLKESLGYYQRAIELDDEDEQAKANYEFVKKKAEELLKKIQQSQNAKGREQRAEGEEKKEQQVQGQQAQQQQAGQEEGQEPESKPEEGQEEQAAAQEKEEGEKEDKQGAGEEGEMSEEQALLLLEGYRQEEESRGQVNFQKKAAPYPEVLKDW